MAGLGVAIIVGAAQADHSHGWPTWALFIMVLGAVIIVLAALNFLFGVLHRPLVWVWSHVRRVRIGLAPQQARVASDDDDLIRFTNAWLIPAWDKAFSILLPYRSEVKKDLGDRIEALLQRGVIDPAVNSASAVRRYLNGERNGELDQLLAKMYEEYESVIRWLCELTEWIGHADADRRRITDWREFDHKAIDHLRDLVASPQLSRSSLAQSFRTHDEGGVAQIVRRTLDERAGS